MNHPPSILIRADGNPDIATGHLMRTLSIALALRERGAAVTFAVSDNVSADLLFSFFPAGIFFPVFVLHSDYRKPETETETLKTLPCLGESDDCLLLVDSYFVTPSYLTALRQLGRVAYLDDLNSFDYPVDCVINYDAAPSREHYSDVPLQLLGLAYTPLRRQFSGLVPRVRPRVKHLLLSTGGTDAANVSGRLLCLLLEDPECADWHYHIPAGPLHAHRQELEQLAKAHPTVHLYEHVENMAGLMKSCDLAVSAAGTTLYELCAAGLPAVSFTMADNQLAVASDMQTCAGIPCGGDIRAGFRAQTDIRRLKKLLLGLAGDYSARLALSEKMHRQIDGKGADRIAEALLGLIVRET